MRSANFGCHFAYEILFCRADLHRLCHDRVKTVIECTLYGADSKIESRIHEELYDEAAFMRQIQKPQSVFLAVQHNTIRMAMTRAICAIIWLATG